MNASLILCTYTRRYVQPGDIGFHASFGGRLDALMTTAKAYYLKLFKKVGKPLKFSAKQFKEIEVMAGCHTWYRLMPREELRLSFIHGGITNNLLARWHREPPREDLSSFW
jgi:hypothetical protein